MNESRQSESRRSRVVVMFLASVTGLALSAGGLAAPLVSASSQHAVAFASVTTTDGTSIRMATPAYVREESSTASGYVTGFGPTVTSTISSEHLPLECPLGTVLVPFHLIKSFRSTGAASTRSAQSSTRLRLELVDGSVMEGVLSDWAYYQGALAGDGTVGAVRVALKNISAVTFEGQSRTSQTVFVPSGRPGGPYIASTVGQTMELQVLLAPVYWDANRAHGSAVREVKWKIGQVELLPDFARIVSIDLSVTGEASGAAVSHSLEVVLNTGEKLTQRGSGEYSGPMLVGTSSVGVVLLELEGRSIHVQKKAL